MDRTYYGGYILIMIEILQDINLPTLFCSSNKIEWIIHVIFHTTHENDIANLRKFEIFMQIMMQDSRTWHYTLWPNVKDLDQGETTWQPLPNISLWFWKTLLHAKHYVNITFCMVTFHCGLEKHCYMPNIKVNITFCMVTFSLLGSITRILQKLAPWCFRNAKCFGKDNF
jgi:hypothetical protein